MFKENEITEIFCENYYKLVRLFLDKEAASSKIKELTILLSYFEKNYDSLNKEELKLLKNVILISGSIISETSKKNRKTNLSECKEIQNKLVKKKKGAVRKLNN